MCGAGKLPSGLMGKNFLSGLDWIIYAGAGVVLVALAVGVGFLGREVWLKYRGQRRGMRFGDDF